MSFTDTRSYFVDVGVFKKTSQSSTKDVEIRESVYNRVKSHKLARPQLMRIR